MLSKSGRADLEALSERDVAFFTLTSELTKSTCSRSAVGRALLSFVSFLDVFDPQTNFAVTLLGTLTLLWPRLAHRLFTIVRS
jgi:hypothetical protein